MREILFRGKRTDNREWVEGSLFQSEGWAAIGEDGEKSGCYILEKEPLYTRCFMNGNSALADNEFIQVSEETVGQYTGMKDKNGKPIFEGDILEAHYDEEHPEDATVTVVKWGKANEAYCWCMENSGGYLDILDDFALTYNAIVGNIHDNPELIEE